MYNKSGLCQHCCRIGKRNKNFGVICPPEVREKISKANLGRNSGAKHTRWAGGSYVIPSRFYSIRPKIRKRDSNRCQNPSCNITERQYHIKRGRKLNLDVHHIDFDTNNNVETNLITLCNVCNIRAGMDKDYWYAFYKYIMELKYESTKKN